MLGSAHSTVRTIRTTFLANLWVGHRPLGVSRLPARIAEALMPVEGAPQLALPDEQRVRTVELAAPDEDGPPQLSLHRVPVGRYPFFHPPISIAALPSPCSPNERESPSLIHIPPARLELQVHTDA